MIALQGVGFVPPGGQSGPLAYWISDAEGAVVAGRVVDFDASHATWVVPVTALTGRGSLHVFVDGIASDGAPFEITPAPGATRCAHDAECGTGFCTDGVCCDRRCDGDCEGCSAARKTSGADGTCGPVPAGRDIAKRCFALQGQACQSAVECATGFCTEGVCCDSTCQGTCLSCTQQGKVGECTAIAEGACDVACDGDHTLKKVGAPDVDCAPFKCDGKQCRVTCASTRECVAPAVCSLDGRCVAPINASPSTASVWGCGVATDGRRRAGGDAFLLALVLSAARRARRRGAP
jgi:hypothetical protein